MGLTHMKAWNEMTSAEKVGVCVELSETQDLSYLEIAVIFGVSRNVIAGTMHRFKEKGGVLTNRRAIGNVWHGSKTKREKIVKEVNEKMGGALLAPKPAVKVTRTFTVPARVAPIKMNKPIVEPPPTGLGVMDLTNHTCRWPQGTGPYSFCGAPTAVSQSGRQVYCEYHNTAAYRPYEKKERTNAKPYGKAFSVSR